MCVNFNEIVGIVLVNPANAAGVEEKISKGTIIDAAYIEERINAADPTSRWTFIKQFGISTTSRENPPKETLNNGIEILVGRDAPRNFEGTIVATSPQYLKELKKLECQNLAFYAIDVTGNFLGKRDDDRDALYPRLIAPNTFYAQERVASGGNTTTGVKVMFSIDPSEKEVDSDYIAASEMDGVNMLSLIATQRTYSCEMKVVGSPADDSVVIDVSTVFGSNKTPSPVVGLSTSNFTLINTITGAAITVTSCAPNGAISGRYLVGFDLTSGIVVRLGFILGAVVATNGGTPAYILTPSSATEFTTGV